MLSQRLALAAALLMVIAVAAVAAEGVPPQAAVQEPAAPERLLARLPQVPEVAVRGREVVWRGQGASVVIVGVVDAGGDPQVETALGPLRVARSLVEDHHLAVVPALSGLVAQAQAAHLAIADLVAQDGLLTGPSLRGAGVVVVGAGVMRQQARVADDRSGEVARVAAAQATLVHTIDATDLGALGRQALLYVIAKLDKGDGGEAFDDFAPSFARRIVRHGWLRAWYPAPADAAAVVAIEQAVVAAGEQRAVTGFRGPGLALEQVADAFGRGGWIYSTPERVLVAHPEPHPEYLGAHRELMTVLELPAGADGRRGVDQAVGARSYLGATPLARWSADQGFACDAQAWRSAVTPRGGALLPDADPPHIVISGLDGDIAGLAVEKGLLRPVQDGTRAAAERFLRDAAALLPDAAHLDLVGEYLFAYVYPTPEAKHPELIGNRQLKGDVQQTVWQTCATALGGIMHGDCADIAELYQHITLQQGRNAIIIGLPEHAACSWAEKSGGDWTVTVLQTGPPLAFTDAVLPRCLELAYKSFDPSSAFDANELPLLLRFSGEVSRSEWSLSWRIFSDPAYARLMFDVQRDWHYQTYQHGIAAMTSLIAGGDQDNANYRELSGLYSSTGQYALAAEYCRKALERTTDPLSRLNMSVQLIGHLLNASDPAAAAAATDVLDRQLPGLKEQLGPAYLQMVLQFAAVCLNEGGTQHLPTPALRALSGNLSHPLGGMIDELSAWLAGKDFNQETWDSSTELRSMRSQVASYCGTIIALVDQLGPDHPPESPELRALSGSVQRWLDGIAFHDVEDDSELAERYALAGQWYEAVQGEAAFDRLLEEAQPARDAAEAHAPRVGGAKQMAGDLPWIRASVPFWYGKLARLFRRDREHLDAALVARYAQRLAEADTATTALGLSSTVVEMQAELGREIAALTAHDERALRQVLRRVADKNDKGLRDEAAQWLGDTARFIDPAWYGTALAAWKDEVDYKPKYFWIAWRAALNGAPQQALMAARLAAERFPDDVAFTAEYGYMRSLLTPAGALAPAGVNPVR